MVVPSDFVCLRDSDGSYLIARIEDEAHGRVVLTNLRAVPSRIRLPEWTALTWHRADLLLPDTSGSTILSPYDFATSDCDETASETDLDEQQSVEVDFLLKLLGPELPSSVSPSAA